MVVAFLFGKWINVLRNKKWKDSKEIKYNADNIHRFVYDIKSVELVIYKVVR